MTSYFSQLISADLTCISINKQICICIDSQLTPSRSVEHSPDSSLWCGDCAVQNIVLVGSHLPSPSVRVRWRVPVVWRRSGRVYTELSPRRAPVLDTATLRPAWWWGNPARRTTSFSGIFSTSPRSNLVKTRRQEERRGLTPEMRPGIKGPKTRRIWKGGSLLSHLWFISFSLFLILCFVVFCCVVWPISVSTLCQHTAGDKEH